MGTDVVGIGSEAGESVSGAEVPMPLPGHQQRSGQVQNQKHPDTRGDTVKHALWDTHDTFMCTGQAGLTSRLSKFLTVSQTVARMAINAQLDPAPWLAVGARGGPELQLGEDAGKALCRQKHLSQAQGRSRQVAT